MSVAFLPDGNQDAKSTASYFTALTRLPLALGLLAAFLASGCGNGHEKPAVKIPEVIVTTPITDEVIDYQDFTGRLSAISTIDIRARVQGYVTQAIPQSREGQFVAKDELLFVIDPRPYKVKYDQAVAQLESARANAVRARSLYDRAYALLGTRAGAQEDVDMRKGDLDITEAAVLEGKAKVEDAKLNLDFCYVTAPTAGRVSRRMADPGNLVLADNTILTTLVTEDPLYAYFDVDERTYLNLLGAATRRLISYSATPELPGSGAGTLGLLAPPLGQGPFHAVSALLANNSAALSFPVLMRLANEDDFVRKEKVLYEGKVTYKEKFLHEGTVNFIDNQVSATSGTIRMRGVFQNPDGLLKPGLFARIRLPVGNPYTATLIPSEALQSDQGRKFVYVVKTGKNKKGEAADMVEYRRVTVGQAVGVLSVILPPEPGKEGIQLGDRIVVTGQQRVRPDVQVKVKTQPPPKRPEATLGRLMAENRPAPEAGRRRGDGGAPPAGAHSQGQRPKGDRSSHTGG
jgi:multidrug efflux pump subunit AcrA (membrane-fusion protein)